MHSFVAKAISILQKIFPKHMDEKTFSCMLSAAKEELIAIIENRLDQFEQKLKALQVEDNSDDDNTTYEPVKQSVPVTANDVAAMILEYYHPITKVRLQQLLYYCQAWSLVWDDKPIFTNEIEAGSLNPIIRDLTLHNDTWYEINELPHGSADNLDEDQQETVHAILKFYGVRDTYWLTDLIHREKPWNQVRQGNIITHDLLYNYYSTLPWATNNHTHEQ